MSGEHTYECRGGRARIVWALAAVVALALALRGYRLGERSLWFDEAFSWRLTTFSWAELLERAARDNNPPLFYAILKLWIACFGESAWALRGLGALCGALTCLGMYLLTVEAARPAPERKPMHSLATDSTRWLAVCTAAFTAVSVFQIRWAREARMYALGGALCAFSSWLLLRALHARGRGGPLWTAYALTALAFAYTHTCAVFSIAAQAVYVVAFCIRRDGGPALSTSLVSPYDQASDEQAGRPRYDSEQAGRPRYGSEQAGRPHHNATRIKSIRGATLAMLVVAAGWLAWTPALLRQRAQVSEAFWMGTIGWRDLPNACYEWFGEQESLSRPEDLAIVAAVVCAAALALLLYRPRPGDGFVFVMAAVPIALISLVSAADTNIAGARYLLFAQLFVLAALPRLAWRLPSLPERGLLLLVLLANLVYPDLELLDRMGARETPGVRGAAASIEEAGRHDEPVVVACPYFFLPTLFHLRNRTHCYLFDDGHSFRHYEGTAVLTRGDLLDADKLAALKSPRVWVVNNHSPALWGRPPVRVPANWKAVRRKVFSEVYGIQGTVEVVEYRLAEQ